MSRGKKKAGPRPPQPSAVAAHASGSGSSEGVQGKAGSGGVRVPRLPTAAAVAPTQTVPPAGSRRRGPRVEVDDDDEATPTSNDSDVRDEAGEDDTNADDDDVAGEAKGGDDDDDDDDGSDDGSDPDDDDMASEQNEEELDRAFESMLELDPSWQDTIRNALPAVVVVKASSTRCVRVGCQVQVWGSEPAVWCRGWHLLLQCLPLLPLWRAARGIHCTFSPPRCRSTRAVDGARTVRRVLQAGGRVRCCRHLFSLRVNSCHTQLVSRGELHPPGIAPHHLAHSPPVQCPIMSHLWWSGAAVALVLQADVARPAM